MSTYLALLEVNKHYTKLSDDSRDEYKGICKGSLLAHFTSAI